MAPTTKTYVGLVVAAACLLACAAGQNYQCIPLPGTMMTASPINSYPGFQNADVCCILCQDNRDCVAYSVVLTTAGVLSPGCYLYNSTVGQNSSGKGSINAVSGRLGSALTHYQNPFSSRCLDDEFNLTIASLPGQWCSSPCVPASSHPCPVDVPNQVYWFVKAIAGKMYSGTHMLLHGYCQGQHNQPQCCRVRLYLNAFLQFLSFSACPHTSIHDGAEWSRGAYACLHGRSPALHSASSRTRLAPATTASSPA